MNRVRLQFLRRRESRVIRGAHAKAGAALAVAPPLPVSRPAAVVGESLFNRADAAPQQPTFTRRAPAQTTPIAGLAPTGAGPRSVPPYVPDDFPRADPEAEPPRLAWYEKLAGDMPLPDIMTPGERARLLGRVPASRATEPGQSVNFYCEPGWTAALIVQRFRTGEWEDWATIAERGFGRNAAEEAPALRHSRQRTATDWRLFCLAIGRPDWIGPGLDRIREDVAQGRRDAEIPAARAS